MKQEMLPPGIHGPSLRWYRPSGAAVWLLRSMIRFWITGKPMWGPGDNATFLHDATVDYRKHPVERLTRARWRRLAWRWGVAGAPIVIGCAGGRWWLAGYVLVAGGSGTYFATRRIVAWWPVREERREMVRPAWEVVCRVLGERYSRRTAARNVIITHTPTLSARIHLPVVPLDEGVKKRIVTSAGERLGILAAEACWSVKGARAFVDIAPRALPPTSLVFADVRRRVLEAEPTRPFIGLAAGNKSVYADLDNDGPHTGLSGGTGTGKSTLLRIILARRVAAGAGLVVCDYKIISHRWARRIAQQHPDRVVYAVDEGEIHETIMAVFGEFERRRQVLKTDPDALETFRDVDLLVEELNSLASMLRKWWQHERKALAAEDPDAYVPTVCPSVDALGVLVQMGRELKIRLHFAAQRLDASVLAPKDGGAVRESITNRFLAKYTKQAWQMLCAGVPFQAFPGGPRGIWTAVINGEVTFFRVPLMTDDEAYALAMSGPEPAGPVLGGRALPAPEAVRGLTLGEAWESLGWSTLAALQKAVRRAELAPVGRRRNALEYDPRQLQALSRRVSESA